MACVCSSRCLLPVSHDSSPRPDCLLVVQRCSGTHSPTPPPLTLHAGTARPRVALVGAVLKASTVGDLLALTLAPGDGQG